MKFNALLVSAAMMVMTLAACGDDDPVNLDNNQGFTGRYCDMA